MAADCLALPYRAIFQSGLHVLSYAYGLPVIATDVGSFRDEDVLEGETGFICNSEDINDLKDTIFKYFGSDLYINLDKQRVQIIKWAESNYSWNEIGLKTFDLYKELLSK